VNLDPVADLIAVQPQQRRRPRLVTAVEASIASAVS
jgi:hypothetical protein